MATQLTFTEKWTIKSLPLWWRVLTYMFFIIHGLWFWTATFEITYWTHDFWWGLLFWGFATMIYMVFYMNFWGVEKIKNMFIWGLLWVIQTYAWLELIASNFINQYSTNFHSFEMFPLYYHIIPSMFFIMITFLLKNLIAEFFPKNQDKVFYTFSLFLFITPYIIKMNS